jgi:hypothetical protein
MEKPIKSSLTIPRKRIILLLICIIVIVILLIAATNFNGLFTVKADVKVTSVDRTKTSHRVYNSNATWDYTDYNDYSFTIQLKNIGNKGAETRVTLDFSIPQGDTWRGVGLDDATMGYIDSGDTTSTTLKITYDKIATENQHLKIEIQVEVLGTDGNQFTDDYQNEFFG